MFYLFLCHLDHVTYRNEYSKSTLIICLKLFFFENYFGLVVKILDLSQFYCFNIFIWNFGYKNILILVFTSEELQWWFCC